MAHVVEEFFETTEAMAMTPGLLTPLPWPDWSARIRSLEVDGARADYVELGPYELDVPPLADRPDLPVRMMLIVVLEGTSVGEVDGHPLTLSPKQAALIDGRASMRFRATGPVRAMRLFVDEDHLPEEALTCPSLPFARLKHTPLVTGCVGLIRGLLQVDSPAVEPHDEVAVSQPLIALQTSLLDQALHTDPDEPEPGAVRDGRGRRALIEAHIDQHLADRDLTVSSIAAALGVTVRTVHAAYEDADETVAGRIRARRVSRAQALIAVRTEPPNVAAIAARVGLGRDQFTRAFQAATGRTARDWWASRGAPVRD